MRSNKRYVAVLVIVLFLASFVIFGRPALRLVLSESQAAADQAPSRPEKEVGKDSPQLAPATKKAATTGPRIWLQERQSMPADDSKRSNEQGIDLTSVQPLSLSSADFDQDGIQDLVVGYSTSQQNFIAIHRGNLDAFAPQSQASFDGIGRNEFPSPFFPNSKIVSVPARPDFVATGRFTGTDHDDIVVGSRSANSLYLLAGDGNGNFAEPETIDLPGNITALASGDFGSARENSTLIVGVSGSAGSSLMVFTGANFKSPKTISVSGTPTQIGFGGFNDAGPDAVVLVNGNVSILRWSTLKFVKLGVPVSASAFAIGSFVFDRSGSQQIAILGSGGSVEIAAPNSFDPRAYSRDEFAALRQANIEHQPTPPFVPVRSFPAGWHIVEDLSGGANVRSRRPPLFFRTRVSSNGADDIMIINGSTQEMRVLTHADQEPGAKTFDPAQLSVRPYNGSPRAALPMRVNIDGRPGVVAIHDGENVPSTMMPLPDPTFTVNRFDDPVPVSPITNACNGVANDCSLREAVLRANALAGTDTIQLAAGTYSLTQGRIASPAYDAVTGTLNINDSVNIIGTVDGGGNPTSIITWGTLTSGLSVDMVMAVNEDISILSNATASISNVIIENGVNHGTHGNDGDGGCMEYDTGTSGNANLTLTNVIIQNCATLQGGGGGIVAFNFLNHNFNGFLTVTNSTIQNNSAVDNPSSGAGGGIGLSNDTRMVMTNSKVLNNNATQVISGQNGQGGGIMAFFPNGNFTSNPETIIHSSTISGNKAAGFGGGIQSQAELLIDQGTIISNNSAGAETTPIVATVPGQEGGGLYLNNFSPASCPPGLVCTATLSHVTITGNSATGNGGGISNGSGSASGALTMSFSRLAGNSTSGGSGSNLNNNHATATVTNNWWGTNAAAGTINSISATTTFDPFIVLTHDATPAIIRINQSTTLIGDMSKDNHGNGAALSGNLDRIVGLPITFDSPVLGTIPQAQPEALGNFVPTAAATFNAGGTSGRGSAHATVDQAVVSANANLIAGAAETGTTVTITTVGAHNFAAGETVVISGVGVAGYNGTFAITGTPTATTFTYTDTAGLAASSGGTANVGIIILEPLQITKSFNPTTVAENAPSTLTFNVTNPDVIAVDASFTDTFPANLVVAAPPAATNTCGGTFTPVAAATSVSFSNPALPVGSCTITVNVSTAVDNVYSNSVTINSTAAGTGAQSTSSANLTVINPPSIVKAFGGAGIGLNGKTSLTFTLNSTNSNLTLNGVAFTDSLPAGLVVNTPGLLASNCGGTATAADGATSVSLSGGASLAPGGSCTISLIVTGTTAGLKNNTVTISSTNGGTGNTSNASVTVGPTAAGVTVSGRILDRLGNGVIYARVGMTDRYGNTVYAMTGSFGYYSFANVAAGGTYVVAVASRRFSFASRVLMLSDNLTNYNFTPLP